MWLAIEILERADHVQLGLDQLQLVLALAELGGVPRQRRAGARRRAGGGRLGSRLELASALDQIVAARSAFCSSADVPAGSTLRDRLPDQRAVGRVGLDDADAGSVANTPTRTLDSPVIGT